jgi:amidophosphoribosyltransferase
MAREAGAKKVYFASSAPPIRYPNVFGIDIPSSQELVASSRTESDIARLIGADRVIFQTLEDLITACSTLNPAIRQFEVSVFNGKYLTNDVTSDYLSQLHMSRCNDENTKQHNNGFATHHEVLGLHNYANKTN